LSDTRLEELADLATEDARAQLALVAEDLVATLAEQRSHDGPNAAVLALCKGLAFGQDLIERCKVRADRAQGLPAAANHSTWAALSSVA
jgi:hypothetical protein